MKWRLLALLVLVTLVVSAQPARAQADIDLLDGLVAWWSLDEASGTRYDAHGVNYLTDINTVGAGPGMIGNAAFYVAANNERLDSATLPALSTNGSDFTVVAWVNASTPASVYGNIVRRWGAYNEYWIYINTDLSNFSFAVRDSSSTNKYCPIAYNNLDGWRFLAMTVNTTNGSMTVRVNGDENTCAIATGQLYNVPNTYTELGSSAYNGYIDNVAFWRRELSSDDLDVLYNYGIGLSYDEISALGQATSYETTLPSGGRGLLTASATAGDVGVIFAVSILVVLDLFTLLTVLVKSTGVYRDTH